MSAGGETEEGVLRCPCERVFPIAHGIPRMLASSAREFSDLLAKHGVAMSGDAREGISETEVKTRKGFNKQIASQVVVPGVGALRESLVSRDHAVFLSATETTRESAPGFFRGKVFLDGGSGGGQYSYDALRMGATVISVDMNDVGLEAFYAAFRDNPRQHAIQASLLRLPVRDDVIDETWSIGVIHHTDSLLDAFWQLARVTKIGGCLRIGVYYRYPGWRYYAAIRKVTTRLPLPVLWGGCRVLATLSYLPRLSFLCHPWVTREEPFRSRVVGAFDHLHPPRQGYYAPEEVAGWYGELGCFEDVHMAEGFNNFVGRKVSSLDRAFSEETRRGLLTC